MALLNHLKKPKDQSPSLEAQITALGQQSEAELQSLIEGDADEALREAAVGKLGYSPFLRQLALDDSHSRLQLAARKRLGELLESGQLALEALRHDLADREQLFTVGSYSPRASEQLLEQVNEPSLLLQLAIEGASIQMRQAAADKLDTRPELEQLYKASQGRDKTIYKLAKTRLDKFKAEDARLAEQLAQAKVVCDKLEQLARVEADPMYRAKLDKLHSDWQAIDCELPADLNQRYQRALSQCQEHLDTKEQVQAQAEAVREREQTQQQTLTHTQQTSCTLIQSLYEADSATINSESYDEQLQQLRDQLAEVRSAADKDKVRTLEKALSAAEKLLATLREHGGLAQISQSLKVATDATGERQIRLLRQALKPSQWLDNALPHCVQQARELLAEREQAEKNAERARRKKIRQLENLVRRGLAAAGSGQVRKARGIHHASLEQRATFEALPAPLLAQLEKLDQAIERLSDWHEFAVTPKKHALIEQMQALKDSTLPPEDLADKVHQLQDNWKELSKGVPHADEDLWHQFKAASDIAYEPCKEFFQAQAKEREHNLAQRDQLIEQLHSYLEGYDWDNPVWEDVERTFKQARREWRSHWPIPRHAIKAQEARFEPLMDQLHAKLNDYYQANKAAKDILVARAKELAQQDNLNEAIEGAKQCQARWKTIGKSRPREDKALWKAFREQCDTIFARRQEQYRAADQQRSAQQEQAEQIIAQLNALAAKPVEQLRAAKSEVAELKSAFAKLNQLPRARAKVIQTHFKKAVEAIEHNLKQAQIEAKERQWQALFAAAEALRLAEVTALQGGDLDAAREEARAAMAQVERWPGSSQKILQQRLESLAHLTPEQRAGHSETLGELCIRADILAGRESPEDERPARMAYQMKLLQKGLGQKHRDSAEELLMAWLTLSGLEESLYRAGLERLKPALRSFK